MGKMSDMESEDEDKRRPAVEEKGEGLVGVLRHPMKKHLVAKKVYRVLPHPRLWNNQYIHTALDIEATAETFQTITFPGRPSAVVVPEIVLKLKTVKALRKDFALFHRPEAKAHEDGADPSDKEEQKQEVEYSFAREYIWKASAVGQTTPEQHFLLRLPNEAAVASADDAQTAADAVYLVPLKGPRLILHKAGSVTGITGTGFASAGGLAGLQALLGGSPVEERGEGPNDAIFSASVVD
eukprot:GHVS01102558.1.p1 GENE.GHVS01102558.1~~GHVS01102558.1.p1  ORF type:complete len:239 (-),score=45.60 GHVS01102558.1:106-822(-)